MCCFLEYSSSSSINAFSDANHKSKAEAAPITVPGPGEIEPIVAPAAVDAAIDVDFFRESFVNVFIAAFEADFVRTFFAIKEAESADVDAILASMCFASFSSLVNIGVKISFGISPARIKFDSELQLGSESVEREYLLRSIWLLSSERYCCLIMSSLFVSTPLVKKDASLDSNA